MWARAGARRNGHAKSGGIVSENVLRDVRREIDGIDREIIALLARRMKLGSRVAAQKDAADLPVIIPHRVREVIESRTAQGRSLGLSPEFTRDIFNRIIWEMCQQEARALRDSPETG